MNIRDNLNTYEHCLARSLPELTPFELIERCAELRDKFGATVPVLAILTNRSTNGINNLLRVHDRLPPVIYEAAKTGRIYVVDAIRIAAIKSTANQLRAFQKALRNRVAKRKTHGESSVANLGEEDQ